jgi:hypothetical protein
MQTGQKKCTGLAAARVRGHEQILPGQRGGNGFVLNGGGNGVLKTRKRAEKGRMQAQTFEVHKILDGGKIQPPDQESTPDEPAIYSMKDGARPRRVRTGSRKQRKNDFCRTRQRGPSELSIVATVESAAPQSAPNSNAFLSGNRKL